MYFLLNIWCEKWEWGYKVFSLFFLYLKRLVESGIRRINTKGKAFDLLHTKALSEKPATKSDYASNKELMKSKNSQVNLSIKKNYCLTIIHKTYKEHKHELK